MTSFKQVEANRANAQKSTGPVTPEGKQRSRCNALRHGLTAEVVIGALEDADDYGAFEQAIIADYDAQSAVERELVRRLAGALWRLRRATTMETGLFEIQADHLSALRARQGSPGSQEALYALFGRSMPATIDRSLPAHDNAGATSDMSVATPTSPGGELGPGVELARCFLRLANQPNFALDRLSRYEFTLWRQARQIPNRARRPQSLQTARAKALSCSRIMHEVHGPGLIRLSSDGAVITQLCLDPPLRRFFAQLQA